MKRIEFATSYTNLFSNPSFESGATGWTIQGGSVVQTYLAKDGSYAVFYDEGGHSPAYILTSNPITLSVGTYEMSIWIYVSSTPSGSINFQIRPDGGSLTTFAQFDFHSAGWKLFTAYVSIDAPGDYYFQVQFTGLVVPTGGAVYVDALELVETANIYEIPVNPVDGLLPSLKGDNIVLTTTLDGSVVLQKYESGYDPRTYNLIWRGYLPLDKFESFYKYLKSLEYLTSGTVYIRDNDIGQIPMFTPINVLRVEAELREGGRPAYREIKMEFVKYEGS